MATLDNASLNNEPALSGWWVAACFAAVGLILLFAALVQQASKLSDTIITLLAGQPAETVQIDASPNSAVVSLEPNQLKANQSTVDSLVVTEAEPSELEPTEIEAATNELATSELAASEIAANEIAESEIAANEITESEVAASEITESEVAAIEATVDEIAENEATALTENITISEPLVANIASVEPSPIDSGAVIESPETPEIEPIALVEALQASNGDDSIVAPNSEELSTDIPENSPPSAELSLATLRRDVLTEMTRRSSRIRFIEQSTELTSEGERLLGLTFEDLFLYAESDVVIQVSSLDGADDSSNQLLSNDRAQSIRAFLIERGFEAERLIISLLPGADEFIEQQYVNIQANL